MCDLVIKNIEADMIDVVLKLVEKVFMEFNAPDYTQEGIDEFKSQIIESKDFKSKFDTGEQIMIGAFNNDKIIGILSISVRNHISLLFVDKNYHRNKVGTKLLNEIIIQSRLKGISKIKLNSSPYALPFYLKFGFVKTDSEKIRNGIQYTPMELNL